MCNAKQEKTLKGGIDYPPAMPYCWSSHLQSDSLSSRAEKQAYCYTGKKMYNGHNGNKRGASP